MHVGKLIPLPDEFDLVLDGGLCPGLGPTTIDITGTFLSGAPMATERTPKPGFRMVGLIVEAPGGNVFFRMVGPAKTVAAAKPAFDGMIKSLKKGS